MGARFWSSGSLYLLSRLKGIETRRTPITTTPVELRELHKFVSAFPFEGNWNPFTLTTPSLFICRVCICFPVWRELKRFPATVEENLLILRLYLLSRLKGIETSPLQAYPDGSRGLVCICFPVWRELKHESLLKLSLNYISLVCICFPVWRELKHKRRFSFLSPPCTSLYLLSRLKGIETKRQPALIFFFKKFVSAFPFEGNWNEEVVILSRSKSCLYLLSRLKGIETRSMPRYFLLIVTGLYLLSRLKGIETWLSPWNRSRDRVCICFPVWRELKPVSPQQWPYRPPPRLYLLSRLKGIETLSVGQVWWFQKFHRLYLLSRLKGIETTTLLRSSKRTHPPFVSAFPFEGNWNKTPSSWGGRPSRARLYLLSRLKGIETWNEGRASASVEISPRLYLLSRLKGIETVSLYTRPKPSHLRFVSAFPFEGNWNKKW